MRPSQTITAPTIGFGVVLPAAQRASCKQRRIYSSSTDIIVKYFEAQGKIIQKDDIVLLFYEEIKGYARGFFETTLPNFEYYEVIFEDNSARGCITHNLNTGEVYTDMIKL